MSIKITFELNYFKFKFNGRYYNIVLKKISFLILKYN